MNEKSLDERQAEMRQRLAGHNMNDQQSCPSCGGTLARGTVSIREVIPYLRSDGFISASVAAEYLGVSKGFVQSRISEIPHYRVGGKWLFKRSDLDGWIELYRQEPMTRRDLKSLVHQAVVRAKARRSGANS